jgi:RNA polymerase sigma factor (sigma-70 family)
MRDARDAEDARLLAEGEIDQLLAGWVETIRGRCVARMRDGLVGEDVAQAVCERLWRELKTGKHRDGRFPFRVVVHQVIGWTCSGWFERSWGELTLADWDGSTADEFAEVVDRLTLEQFVATLPAGDGEVASLLWLEGLDPAEIARRLGKQPNAVHQAVHRNKGKLREWLEA